MPLFGGSESLQRFYPAPAPEVFSALTHVVRQRFRLNGLDDFTLSCTFSSSVSAFTWGEN